MDLLVLDVSEKQTPQQGAFVRLRSLGTTFSRFVRVGAHVSATRSQTSFGHARRLFLGSSNFCPSCCRSVQGPHYPWGSRAPIFLSKPSSADPPWNALCLPLGPETQAPRTKFTLCLNFHTVAPCFPVTGWDRNKHTIGLLTT